MTNRDEVARRVAERANNISLEMYYEQKDGCKKHPYPAGKICVDCVREALISSGQRVEELEEALRWIPVEEKLPEFGSYALIIINGVVQHLTAVFHDYGWEWSDETWDELPTGVVTHWMPLPKPPEAALTPDLLRVRDVGR